MKLFDEGEAMSIEHNRAVVERFDALLGSEDLSELDDLCTPDMVNHSLASDRPKGLAGTRQFLAETGPRFGHDRWAGLQTVAEGALVVQHGMRGGNWQGGTVLGFDLQPGVYNREVVFIYRLQDARIAERWAVRDDLTMLRQLGGL
jgi:predicted ester cyclase